MSIIIQKKFFIWYLISSMVAVYKANLYKFYAEVADTKKLWTVCDDEGFPAPKKSSGQRVRPFWSSKTRVERIIKNVPAYNIMQPYELSWKDFENKIVTNIKEGGLLVGLNWSGPYAEGYDFDIDIVIRSVEDEMFPINARAIRAIGSERYSSVEYGIKELKERHPQEYEGRKVKSEVPLELQSDVVKALTLYHIAHPENTILNKLAGEFIVSDATFADYKTLPPITELLLIKGLDISNLKLKDLPQGMQYLKHLELLVCNNNQLTVLPDEICTLYKLKGLGVRDNLLTKLPDEIRKLENLEILTCSNNQIVELPPRFGELKKIKKLDIHNNPIKDIPLDLNGIQELYTTTGEEKLKKSEKNLSSKLVSIKTIITGFLGGLK